MPRWLVEDPTPVYWILGVLAVGLAVGWWVTRQRKYLVGLGAVAALAGLVWLLDFLVVTDSEKIVLAVKDMAAGVETRDTNRIFSHISNDFHLPMWDKKAFREMAEEHIRNGDLNHLSVGDFEPTDVSRAKRKGRMAFSVKPRGRLFSGSEYFLCRADFVLEDDGQWRMVGLEVFNPFVETNQPLQIPSVR